MYNNYLFSQNRINDMGLWLSAQGKYKINKVHSFSVRIRLKFIENISEFVSLNNRLKYTISINDFSKLSFQYSFILKQSDQNYFFNRHRYSLRLDNKKIINKYLTLHNRIILQYSTHRFITDFEDNGYKPYYRTDFRERVGFSYNLSSTSEIYLHNEWMITLSQTPVELRRNRLYAGYEKQYSDRWAVKYYFVLQSSFHKRKSPDINLFIFGMDINFKLN